tara:strand:- start:9228 stop:9965 length:738 start_codon:yes stop_codon:yes gene_type:complete
VTSNLNPIQSVAIFGSNGSLGNAFIKYYLNQANIKYIYSFSRVTNTFNHPKVHHFFLDISDEKSISDIADVLPDDLNFDLILITSGFLHNEIIAPEKSVRFISQQNLLDYFNINAISPILIAKYFSKFLPKNSPSIFAALSARVGSIGDNKLGGWYGYRASKAALNMFIKTLSIEFSFALKQSIVIGLHPGTVDSNLSKPFLSNYKKNSVFSPEESVSYLVKVLNSITVNDSGKIFAWDGSEIVA